MHSRSWKERAVTTLAIDLVDRLRDRIEELLGAQRFKIWFKNCTQLSIADGILKVGVPNLFISGWIEDHYDDVIRQAAQEIVGGDVKVTYCVDPVLFRKMRKSTLNSQAAFIEKHAERSGRDGENGKPVVLPPQRTLRGRMEDFVVGSNNRLAYSVAQSVIEHPNGDSSVVCIYSACGLGKTHLLQGIANALSERKPRTRWVYASGEDFTNQFLYALREHKLDAFRHRYRDIDVLLLDDMQFIANKRATQEEFLHTFNAISGAGKRVVLATDAHPKMIGELSDSLVNRLVSGMVVKIERPDVETRKEILRRRAHALQQNIPDSVLHYIAEKIQANVRELEGCLVKLLAFASLTREPISLDMARRALEDHLTQTRKLLTVAEIEQSVATYFGILTADLHTSRKSRTIALARNVAMFIARKHTDLSFPEIGRMMGNKNHTTVLLACRRITQLLATDSEVNWPSISGIQARPIAQIISAQEEQLGCQAPA
ncbi:MAG: chromosomal replication initiator protein DnaA [Planctomycetota bacterium]|nr:MAG: chromosomal replication initiator protein DnaA [Planctomycetota bacterium]